MYSSVLCSRVCLHYVVFVEISVQDSSTSHLPALPMDPTTSTPQAPASGDLSIFPLDSTTQSLSMLPLETTTTSTAAAAAAAQGVGPFLDASTLSAMPQVVVGGDLSLQQSLLSSADPNLLQLSLSKFHDVVCTLVRNYTTATAQVRWIHAEQSDS